MSTDRGALVQWNVRLDADTSAALRRHLGDPLLVGLPKGKLAEFMTRAIRAELTRLGAWPPATPTSAEPPTFF